jgi:hypothetical protein
MPEVTNEMAVTYVCKLLGFVAQRLFSKLYVSDIGLALARVSFGIGQFAP